MLSLDQLRSLAQAAMPAANAANLQAVLGDDSALAQAQAALSDFQSDALSETMEDLSLSLSGRLRESATGAGPKQAANARPRVLAQKLVAEVASVDAVTLDDLLDSAGDWQDRPQPLLALAQQEPDPARRALLLAATLAHGKARPGLRRQLEDGLAALADGEELGIGLFGALEFGVNTPALRQDLRRLYHRANLAQQKMSQWLRTLGARDERQRKLRAMLRVLAFELSASGQPIVGHHLAAVIGDLQQLLRIIGLEAHCDHAAAAMRLPALDGEAVLHSVVSLVEQVWVSADSVGEALPALPDGAHYRVYHTLGQLLQMLPEDCFNDAEHKLQVQQAVAELRERAADQEAPAA